DDYQPIRLGHLRRDLCEVLGAAHSDRDWKSQLRPHATPNCCRYFGGRAKEMDGTRHIGKGLVDGNPLDERGEITQHLHGAGAQPLVVLEMPADKSELRAKLARVPSRHPAANPEGLGFIRSGKHDLVTNGDRLVTQRGVEQLLDRGVERVEV